MKLPKLILASGSPRRAEILNSVGWEFTKLVADIDEAELPNEDPAAYVQRLAAEKAMHAAKAIESGLVLGADTTVVVDKEILAKPTDIGDARRMLRLLSGCRHEVLTGVALVHKTSKVDSNSAGNNTDEPAKLRSIIGIQRTVVKFSEMNELEINYLAEKGDPLDKAGAYAVQAQAALFIEEIEGDYWNVVGLPISLVYRLLTELERQDRSITSGIN